MHAPKELQTALDRTRMLVAAQSPAGRHIPDVCPLMDEEQQNVVHPMLEVFIRREE